MVIHLLGVVLERAPVDATGPDDFAILVPLDVQVTLRDAVKGAVVRDVTVVKGVVRRVYALLGAHQANLRGNLRQHGVLALRLRQRPHIE